MPNRKKPYKETRKKRFNLLLTNEEFNFLKEISKLEDKSIAEILRVAVEYLYQNKSKEDLLVYLDYLKKKTYLNSKDLENYIQHYQL